MKYNDLLNETYLNFTSNEISLKEEYAGIVFDMIQAAYASIGGIKGFGFMSPQDMIDHIELWKLSRRNGAIVAVAMYNGPKRKRVAIATDGTTDGKRDLAKIIKDDYTFNRTYAEISGPSLRFHKKLLGDSFKDIIVPSRIAMSKFRSEDVREVNDTEYERFIGGTWIKKTMVGNINSPDLP